MKELNAGGIIEYHDGAQADAPATPLWSAIAENHRYNSLLWEEEDLARRRQVPDSAIATNTRNLERHTQRRNDAIERVDEQLLQLLAATSPKPDARLHSETPGAMIDRLSILSLRGLAAELGTSHRMLIHHFGSNEGLWVAIIREVEQRQLGTIGDLVPDPSLSFDESMRTWWRHICDPSLWPN